MVRDYHRPTTVQEALRRKAEAGDAAAFLAGGTSVDPANLRAEPEVLIDLAGLGLDRIEASDAGIGLGACVTIQALLEDERTPGALRAAAAHVVNRHIRNVATLGGQLGANESNGDLLPALVALRAEVVFATAGGWQRVPVADFLAAPTAGLITEVRIPKAPTGRGTGVAAFSHTANDKSVVTAAVSLSRGASGASGVVVAIGGVAPRVVRLAAVEAALEGRRPDQVALAAVVGEQVHPKSDHRGSAVYRAHLAGVLVERAAALAWKEAE